MRPLPSPRRVRPWPLVRSSLALALALTSTIAIVRSATSQQPAVSHEAARGTRAAAAPGGAGFFGSTGNIHLNAPIVGMARTASGSGYWLVASDGGIFAFGDAAFLGSTGAIRLNAPIVGMAPTPSGRGYWLVARDGGVFSFGDAFFAGSMGGQHLNAPIVGMAAGNDAAGYWLVAADGGVFDFGAPYFAGSVGGMHLNAPVVGMAADLSHFGYWLVAADGGVFSLGHSRSFGSTGNIRLNRPIAGMAATPTGGGYWLVATDGGIFAFGDAAFLGSAGAMPLNRPVVGMAATPAGSGYWLVASDGGVFTYPNDIPSLTASTVIGGLSVPWDLAFLPDGTMIFTERAGRLSALVNGQRRTLSQANDIYANGEAGMEGLAVDPAFASNRRIYTCQSWTDGNTKELRVVSWRVADDLSSATRAQDPLLGGMDVNSFHDGCRPRFGPDGVLWVGTGDAGVGTNPQNKSSLNGKVLRIDKMTGAPAPGNPFGSAVYNYGHRNVQGLAVRPGTDQVFEVEHGPDVDDEVNLMVPGANYGWDPVPGYNQSVPMTDLKKFPDAVSAVWSSGAPTIAPSGGTFVSGGQWGAYNGALVIAALKGMQLRALFLDAPGKLVDQKIIFSGNDRLRSPVLGPDGNLYVTTSNGSNDRIIRFTPS